MDVFEITGYQTGTARDGVTFLEPADSFQTIKDGFIHRQVLQSRRGFAQFANKLSDETRVMGIFEFSKQNNTSELLVCSKNYLYKYNEGTDAFDQISFAGSAAAFAISSNSDYVSGTSYPAANGADRFIFTGKGMSDTYVYDGTDVQSYTLDVAAFANPASGTLTSAWHVMYHNGRLNFVSPRIAGSFNPQQVLYSGINDSAGNGDKFNVVGSGAIEADTGELVRAASIMGDTIVLRFTRSDWVLEKTRDAFNPYIIRRIPSVLGTDAGFSNVQWAREMRSIGRTGVISTDLRVSNRIDNKIPNFTDDEIDPENFDLCYGGFDRENGQFLFSYLDNNSSADTQDKVLVQNYEEDSWSVFDMRTSVFGQTDKGVSLTWNDINSGNNPSWAAWNSTTEIWNKIGKTASTQKTLFGDDEGFVYQINQDHDDYYVAIDTAPAITQASPAVITTSTDHSFQVGDEIVVTGALGMTAINNYDPASPSATFVPYVVSARTDTTVTINADMSSEPAHSGGGAISKPIRFLARTIPFNPYRDKGRGVYVSHVELLLNSTTGRVKVSCYADEDESPFKSGFLIPNNASTKKRQWITLAVNQEADFITFEIEHMSPQKRYQSTSMRIHASVGGNK